MQGGFRVPGVGPPHPEDLAVDRHTSLSSKIIHVVSELVGRDAAERAVWFADIEALKCRLHFSSTVHKIRDMLDVYRQRDQVIVPVNSWRTPGNGDFSFGDLKHTRLPGSSLIPNSP